MKQTRHVGTHFHRGLVDPDVGFKQSSPEEQWEMIRINGVFNLIYRFFESTLNSMVSQSRRGDNTYTNALPPYFDRAINENAWMQIKHQHYPHSTYVSERLSRRKIIAGGYGNISEQIKGRPHLQHCSYYRDPTGTVRGLYYNNPEHLPPGSTPSAGEWSRADIEWNGKSARAGTLAANMETVKYARVVIDGIAVKPSMQNAGSIVRQWNKHYNATVRKLCSEHLMSQAAAKALLAQDGMFRMSALDLIAHSAYQMVESAKWDQSNIQYTRQRWNDDGQYHIEGNYPGDYPRESRASGNSRYTHVNPHSIKKYGTVEVRQMQGILNPTKSLMWAELIDLMMNKAIAAVENDLLKLPKNGDFKLMMSWFGLQADDEFAGMWRRRISVINKDDYNVLHDIKCTTCGKHYCDNDNACGQLPQYDPYAEIRQDIHELDSQEFLQHLHDEETYLSCDHCGEDSAWHNTEWYESSIVSRNPPVLTNWCPECGDDEAFSLDASLLGLVLTAAMGVISPLALVVGCGIGFIHAAGKKWKYTARAKRLWGLLTERGGQAAGVGIGTQGTSKRRRSRAATSALSLKSRLDKYCGEATSWVIKHTRYATHGKNVMENAHPHAGPDKKVMLVHNGVVTNQDAVYKGLGIESLGPVDSQAVAACIRTRWYREGRRVVQGQYVPDLVRQARPRRNNQVLD